MKYHCNDASLLVIDTTPIEVYFLVRKIIHSIRMVLSTISTLPLYFYPSSQLISSIVYYINHSSIQK